MAKSSARQKRPPRVHPKNSGNVPATHRHLELVRKELKSDIAGVQLEVRAESKSVRSEMKSEFADVRTEMRAEFTAVRTEMRAEFTAVRTEMRAEFADVRAEMRAEFTAVRTEMQTGFAQIDIRFQRIESVLFEMKALLEEQNARNKVVMDGYTHLYDIGTVRDKRIDQLEKKVFGIIQK